ncbi:MAG TPA: hypothetical protein VMT63_08075 [Bacteroidales bacterium]|nr:hypothetical protein [Bacteroidales bacterium]
MKKLFLIVSAILILSSCALSQEVGIRVGEISGGKGALDVTWNTARYNRIHADISFGSGTGVDFLWDLLYRPLFSKQWKWYLGAGPYAKFVNPVWLGAVGEAGIEYRFKKAPVAMGFDWRPFFSIIQSTGFTAEGYGLNIRYVFGRR